MNIASLSHFFFLFLFNLPQQEIYSLPKFKRKETEIGRDIHGAKGNRNNQFS